MSESEAVSYCQSGVDVVISLNASLIKQKTPTQPGAEKPADKADGKEEEKERRPLTSVKAIGVYVNL